MHMGAYEEPENKQTSNNNKNNDKKMEAQEITAIANEATAKEKARVDAWMVFAEIDLAKVKAGVDSGKKFPQKK